MAGYARQSSSSIADGETITAAPLNSEFDAVLAAFAFSGGHNHDGSSTEGAYVGILADVDALNKIVVDNTNNRHGFFVEVSSSAVEQIRIQDGAIVPVTSNDIDLGTSSLQYKDIHIDGTAYIDTLEIHVGASLSAGVLSLPDGSASAPVITNTGDTNQGLYFSGTDEMSFTAGGTAQVTFADGVIKPVTDNDVDLGTSSLQFKDIHINGTANIDTLAGTTMSGNLAMGSNKVTGLAAPSADGDAARKVYVDDSIASAEGLTQLAGNINVNGFHFFGSSGEDIKFKPVGSASILSTQDTDGEFVALVLRNESDAADTTGIASLRFDLEDTGGNTVDAAKIAVKKEASFTATAATQDSSMVFSTSLNGTLTEYLKLTSAGIVEPITDNTVDIGTSAKQIKDIYVHGTAYLDAIGFGTTSITLPTADGSANQILKTNGSGTLSFADDTGTTINNATENELVTVSSTTTQLDGEANLTFDGTTLTLNGKLAMASNTAGKLLIADGTDFEPTAVGDLSEISSVASDDILIALDTSGGGLKKITRANLVSGLATSSAISNVVEDTSPQLGGDLDAQGKDITDVGILSADASAGIYGATGSPVVFTVTVASKTSAHPYNGDGSSSGYFLNGVESPALKLHGADSVTSSSGYYYKFDQAEGTNSGHPLRFYLDAAKTIAYTTGVTTSGTPGTAGAHTTIAVTDQTPSTLYYQCSSHGYMGNYASVDSANITSSGAVSIDAVGDVTIDADGGDIIFKDAGTTFGSATNTSGDLILKSGTTTALTFDGANATVAGNLVVTGNHTVNGTTTTVNSTTVTIDDPIFTLGGDGTPGSDDNKDRGIEFKYHTGSAAKVGFFGWDDSAGAFTFVPDATNSSEVFSGSVGNAIFGNVTGTLQTAAQTNITSVGALDGGSITSNFGTIDTGASAITTTGLISGGSLDIDNVLINGTTIGHTDDTDLLTLANGALTVAGTIEGTTITASTALVPDASGGADLGSTSLEWGDLYIADDKKIYLGSDQDISIEYDEDGNNTTAVVAAGGVSFAPHGTGTGNGTELRFQELAANGANYVGFKSPDAIASNEVWVLPNADGSDGQVLKTDGSNALSWGEAGGGGTVDMVADGAIAIRKPVVLTAAGKAKQVAYADAAAGVGTALALDSTVSGSDDRTVLVYMDGIGSGVKTFLKIFCDGGTSNHITAIAFTIDDTGARTITAGTPVVVTSNDTAAMDAVFDPDTDRVIMVYRNGDASDQAYYSVISVSGTTVTASTVATLNDDNSIDARNIAITYDTSADRVAVIYYDQGASGQIRSYVGTVTGGTTNSVAWGSNVDADGAASNVLTRLCYDVATNRHLLVWRDDAGIQSRVGTLTGSSTNTIAWGSQTTLNTDSPSDVEDTMLAYEATQQKCVFGWNSSSTTQKFGVITVTGASTNTAAIGSLISITRDDDSGAPNSNALSAIAASKVAYVYNVSNTVKVVPLTISGTSLSAGTAVTVASADTANIQIAGVVATGAAAITFETNNTSINAIEYRSATISGGGATPLTKDNYLGVAKAAISDGATGKIVIPGGISEGHSSLTIGSNIFTNGAGAIGLAGDSGGLQFLGRAVSATQIQLQEEEFNFYAEADGAVTEGNPIELSGGKIKEIVGSVIASAEYSQPEDTASTDGEKNVILYDPDTQRIVAIYNGPSSNRIKGAVGVLTGGTTNSISWGTPVVIDSSHNTSRIGAAYDETADRVVVAYGGNDGTNWVGASRVLQITGGTDNTITVGSSASFSSSGNGYQQKDIQCTYDPDVGKVFATYFEENISSYSSSRTYGAVATVTAGTNAVSWGSQNVAGTSGNTHEHTPSCNIYHPDVNKGFFIYMDDGDSDKLKINMMNISSSSISFDGGTDHNPNSKSSTNYPRSTYDTERDRILTAYTRSGNVYAVSTSVSVDGSNNETYSSAAEFAITTNGNSQSGTSYNQTNMVYNSTDGVHLLIYNDGDNNNYSSAIELTVAANGTVSKGVPSVVASDTPWSSTNVMYEPNANRYVAIKENSDNRTAIMVLTGSVDTTKTNFDGFAQITASDGNATAAKIDFEIDDNRTGLTAGTTYYLDSNTDITTTSSSNQKVGVALSSTELQIVKT